MLPTELEEAELVRVAGPPVPSARGGEGGSTFAAKLSLGAMVLASSF